MNSVKQYLEAALAKISDPEHWVQGTLGKNEIGGDIDKVIEMKHAVCFCSIGALCAVDAETAEDNITTAAPTPLRKKATDCLTRAAMEASPAASWGIVGYNDHHTHDQVMGVWKRAIEIAEVEYDEDR